jgi:murein DD-endopeptidase MepM/ murein hydrolase activator NlpD
MLILLIVTFLLTACQPASVASVAMNPGTATSTADAASVLSAGVPPLPSTTVLAPPQINIITEPTKESAPAAFSLVNPEDLVTNTPVPTATAVTIPDPAEIPSDTPTPQPTFTPPALPQTALDEHYWLRRPIAEGGTVWTDKTYPYGSTRGGTLEPHHGVEFYVPTGTEILATASGTVRVAGKDDAIVYGLRPNFYGQLVVIELDSQFEGQPIYTLYGHLSQIFVSEGQHVDAEQVIALSGATGVADGPHLHFEVRQGKNSYDATRNPLLWLWPVPESGTIAGRVTFANGTLAYEAPVRAVRVDASSAYAATTTYADESLNADDILNENFALDDVDAGYYEIIVDTGGKKYKTEVWVYPRRTSFVEIVLGN